MSEFNGLLGDGQPIVDGWRGECNNWLGVIVSYTKYIFRKKGRN